MKHDSFIFTTLICFCLPYKYQIQRNGLKHVKQGCTKYGPRAKCGPRKFPHTPPRSPYFVCLVKTHFECVKIYQFWPMPKTFFWPEMRHELDTPDLNGQHQNLSPKSQNINFEPDPLCFRESLR